MTHPIDKRTQFTQIVESIEGNASMHANEILPLVYDELHSLATARLSKLPRGLTIQATVLVHEAYLRLAHKEDKSWQGRKHFFFAAARAMRDIVVEDARAKACLKRGADFSRVTLSGLSSTLEDQSSDLLTLNDALEELEVVNPEAHQIILLRFFCGLSMEECAEISELSPSTSKRKWRFGRAWLLKKMSK